MINKRRGSDQNKRGASRVLTRCVKISATSADMRTGFCSLGAQNTLQSESSSSRQPRFAMGASPKENQSPRELPLGLSGAATRIRTGDLILTKDVLYQLSHSSIPQGYFLVTQIIITNNFAFVNTFHKKYFCKLKIIKKSY